jgi:glutamate racemase
VRFVSQTVPGLVEQIEAGRLEAPETEALLRRALAPILEAGADTIVLACTHYPFVIPLISKLSGPHVTVIDPAPAIARQAGRLRSAPRELPSGGSVALVTSGDPAALSRLSLPLLGEPLKARPAEWRGATLVMID